MNEPGRGTAITEGMIMVTHIERDERVTFASQLAQSVAPVTLMNTFHVEPGNVEAFLRAWEGDGRFMSSQPGFVSTQLYRGTADSTTFVNIATWESSDAMRDALASPEFRDRASHYPAGTTSSPHAFTKVAVPGVCDA